MYTCVETYFSLIGVPKYYYVVLGTSTSTAEVQMHATSECGNIEHKERAQCLGQIWIGACVRPDAWTTVLVRSQHLVRQVSPKGQI